MYILYCDCTESNHICTYRSLQCSCSGIFRHSDKKFCYLFNTYTVQGFNSLWTPIYNSDNILFVFLFSLIMNYKNTLVLGVKQLQFAAKSKHGMKRKIGQYTKFHSISYINLRKNPYSTNLFFVKFDDTNLIRYP